ncbi:hypothetical protein [Tenacibaculum amylolyticum]|uniref:hypothetical protein n=1 Tax=Tenacibaculum amylolyticum TaxID=104269 RepID=UPI003894C49B
MEKILIIIAILLGNGLYTPKLPTSNTSQQTENVEQDNDTSTTGEDEQDPDEDPDGE